MSVPTMFRSVAAELTSDLASTSGATATVIAPFTGEVLHDLPLASVAGVADAAATARAAQIAWRASSHAHRRAILLRAHDLLLERRDLILDTVQLETGKTRGQAFEELFQGASVARYYGLKARGILAPQRRRAAIPFVMQSRVIHKPKGLVGVITPWNYPLSLSLMDVIPALAAGNAVIQKADNQGSLSILVSRRAFIDAGLPAALWAVVCGPGDEVGNAVVDASDYVCFTGSTPTGTRVAERAAARLVGTSLELGGKNALIVLDDADPERAAEAAIHACFSSMGQLCVSMERIFVHRSVAEAFSTAFSRRVSALSQGAALDYSTDVGSLTSAAQLDRVEQHVSDATARGATVLAGGSARPDLGPFFFEPTVLTGVTSEMQCFADETFGPVVAIYVVDSVDEAVSAANDSAFGLNASIFSGSRRRARRLAESLEAGSVNINEGYRASFGSLDAPMGGVKKSGMGRRNGPGGLLRFTESSTIAEATGILKLPATGEQWRRLVPLMLLVLGVLKAIRRG